MMQFREIKDAIVQLLGDEAESRFRVLGYKHQSKSADEIKDNNRLVLVRYSDGEFPKNKTRMRGPKTHDMNYDIELSASAAASVDLSVLKSDTATAAQKAAALLAANEAGERADTQIDELIEYVYQILMDARNEKLNLADGDTSNRWIARIQKDNPLEHGDLVVCTALIKYSCTAQETVLGDLGNRPDEAVFDMSMEIDGETISGVEVTNPL